MFEKKTIERRRWLFQHGYLDGRRKENDFHRSGQCCTGLFRRSAFCWPRSFIGPFFVGRSLCCAERASAGGKWRRGPLASIQDGAFESNEKPTCRPIEFRWTNDGPFSRPHRPTFDHRLASTFIFFGGGGRKWMNVLRECHRLRFF